MKYSDIYISDYQSIKELKEGVKEYINKYNFKRFHSSINNQQPMYYYLETYYNFDFDLHNPKLYVTIHKELIRRGLIDDVYLDYDDYTTDFDNDMFDEKILNLKDKNV